MKINKAIKSKHSLQDYSERYMEIMYLKVKMDRVDVLKALKNKHIGRGLYLKIPQGYKAQMGSRSGLVISKDMTVLNYRGTIYTDFRDRVLLLL